MGVSELLKLFSIFFKIGAFTFGGGYAMIPLIEKEVVTKQKWVSYEEVVDVFVIAQSIPGAIAINSSTFIGYKIAGRKGAIVATAGVVLPSIIIITIIASFFTRFQDNLIVKGAFRGIRSCIVALIILAGIKISKTSVKDKFTFVITAIGIIIIIFFNVKAILIILVGGGIGIMTYVYRRMTGKLKKEEENKSK